MAYYAETPCQDKIHRNATLSTGTLNQHSCLQHVDIRNAGTIHPGSTQRNATVSTGTLYQHNCVQHKAMWNTGPRCQDKTQHAELRHTFLRQSVI